MSGKRGIGDLWLRPNPLRHLQQPAHRLDEAHHRDRLGDIAFGAGVADALLVALGGIGRHRHDRHRLELRVAFQLLDQLEPADVGHLDVHDDEIGSERARPRHRLAPVADRLGMVAVRPQQIAEQLQVEFVVLDNEDFLAHARRLKP
jgi:hypothetical protein